MWFLEHLVGLTAIVFRNKTNNNNNYYYYLYTALLSEKPRAADKMQIARAGESGLETISLK